MGYKTLRQMAKDFSSGNIDQATYRESRTELIKGIIDGTIPLQENIYPPPVTPPPEPAKRIQHETTEIRAAPVPGRGYSEISATADRKLSIPVVTIGIIAILLAVIIGFIMISVTSKQTDDRKIADSTITEESATLSGAKASNKIINDFLARKLWDNDALELFRRQWDQLTPEEAQVALGSNTMKRLSNAIHRKLLEEQSLKAIGDSQAAAQRQEQLIDFASSIGIVDPRINSSLFKQSPEQ